MEYDKIVILTDEADIPRIAHIIDSLNEFDKTITIGKIIYGQIGKDALISFNTDKQHCQQVLDKLYHNKIIVLRDLKPVDEQQLISLEHEAVDLPNYDWRKSKVKLNLEVPIEQYVDSGKYQELIKISRNIRLGQIIMTEAKRRLRQSILKAIELAQKNFIKSGSAAREAIKSLIAISSDPTLKTPQYSSYTRIAVDIAIKLVSLRTDEIYRLIDICNNNEIHHIGPVKAAITFTEIVFRDPEIFEEELEYAVKKINIRWLQICFPIVEHELTDKEIALFYKLMDYIANNR